MDPLYVTIIAGICSVIALFAGLLIALRLQVPKQLALKKTIGQLESALRDRQDELKACQEARAATAETTARVQQQADAHQALEIEAAELRSALAIAEQQLRAGEQIAASERDQSQAMQKVAESRAAAADAQAKSLQERLEDQQAKGRAALLQACRMGRLALRDHYVDQADKIATSLRKLHEQDAPRRDAIRALLDAPVDDPSPDIERERAEAMTELERMNSMHTIMSSRRTGFLQLVEAIDEGLRSTSRGPTPAP